MATKTPTKKPTLTLAKPVAKRGAETTNTSTGRSHSTRAKQAARRDGRELPVVRAKTKDPLIAATPTTTVDAKTDYRSKSMKPRTAGTSSAGGGGRSTESRAPRESGFKGRQETRDAEPRRGPPSSRPPRPSDASDRPRTPRGALARRSANQFASAPVRRRDTC